MIKAVIFDMDGVLIDTEKWLNRRDFILPESMDLQSAALQQSIQDLICKRYLDRNLIMKRSGRDANSS